MMSSSHEKKNVWRYTPEQPVEDAHADELKTKTTLATRTASLANLQVGEMSVKKLRIDSSQDGPVSVVPSSTSMKSTASVPDEPLEFDQERPKSFDKPEQKPLPDTETEKSMDGPKQSGKSLSAAGRQKATIVRKGKKKEPKKLMTPLEYILKLQESVADDDVRDGTLQKVKKRSPQFLRGKAIFYVGGDNQWASATTRGRLDFIARHGGTLQSTYDPETTTHIVTDDKPFRATTLKALGLSKLSEIRERIPTVTWSWIVAGHDMAETRLKAKVKGKSKKKDSSQEGSLEYVLPHELLHAAFHERIHAGPGWNGDNSNSEGTGVVQRSQSQKTSQELRIAGPSTSQDKSFKEDSENDEGSASDEALQTRDLFEAGKGLPSSTDPLAEFYALAKAQRDAAPMQDGDQNSSDLEPENGQEELEKEVTTSCRRSKWTCDRRDAQQILVVNQDIIDKLEQLMQLHKSKPSEEDQWRVFSYGKAIRAIRNYPERIKSYTQARSIRGVGEKTALKIVEILQTGDLRRIGYEKTDDVEVTRLFQGIYGVGQKTAFTWYNCGCRTLEDVRMRKGGIKLSGAQEIGLRFYDDINSRMPRNEAQEIFDRIKPIVLNIDPKVFVEIMGSFRRGKADCGDIDILITRPTDDGKTHAGILLPLLKALHEAKILTEDLTLPEDADAEEAVYRGLCLLSGRPDAKRRRLDILTVPWKSRGAALLYYTGDDIFNRAIRLKANVLGYSLNQRGLFAGVVRNPSNRREKLNEGYIIASETEEEIFKILGVPWQEPHERVRG